MVRHNNMIPNGHFHKKWKEHVKLWFDQPMKKKRRNIKRKIKSNMMLPRPVEKVRPIIQCPTIRYNTKIRIGRGFSLMELKKVNISKGYAQSIGIAVDNRRQNKSREGLQRNAMKLREYLHNLIVYPLNKKKQKVQLEKSNPVQVRGVNFLIKVKPNRESRIPSEEEKQFKAFKTLREARLQVKPRSRSQKNKKTSAENVFNPPQSKKTLLIAED